MSRSLRSETWWVTRGINSRAKLHVPGRANPPYGSSATCGLRIWLQNPSRHCIVRIAAGERGKPSIVLPHLVTHRRVESMRQRACAVESDLVSLHEIHPGAGQKAYPVETGIDFELPNAGQARHVLDMFSEIVAEPGIQILGLAFVAYEISTVRLTRRVRERRLVHGKGTNQHRLLHDIGIRE